VGLLTIAMLMKNTVEAAERRMGRAPGPAIKDRHESEA
jgi:hypothetical protein